MITAFVACMDDEQDLPIRGNGKTCSMTGYALLAYRSGFTVYTNYKTDFSHVMGLQQMINTLGTSTERENITHENTILAVTELGKILNSLGSDTKVVLFVESFLRQLRKLGLTLYVDDQRFMNMHKRFRIHVDTIFITEKIHLDGRLCYNDLCKKEHIINVYSEKPFIKNRVRAFYASEVGKHYNSNEFILDEIVIPKKEKIFEEKKEKSSE